MNIRRKPFQFTTIDPAKRQAELQKRFGLPSNEMYVDCGNPDIVGAGSRESTSIGGSPRLQHRVPMFASGFDQIKTAGCQNNVDIGHKPRVRVIPIEVEEANESTIRQRTFSGPTGLTNTVKCDNPIQSIPISQTKSSNLIHANRDVEELSRPKVCNIPVQIESRSGKKLAKSSVSEPSVKLPDSGGEKITKTNGCATSKTSVKYSEPAFQNLPSEKSPEPDMNVPLMQIESVLIKLKTYHEEVEKLTGPVKDKQYRYLDEMLTRCMLDLDNVETMGLDNVRQSRKAAVKQVQASLDLLESKINVQSARTEFAMNPALPDKKYATGRVSEDVEMTDATAEDAVIELDTTLETSEPVTQDINMETGEVEELSTTSKITVSSEKLEVTAAQTSNLIIAAVSTVQENQPAENCTNEIPEVGENSLEMKAGSVMVEEINNSCLETELLNSKVYENLGNEDVPEPLVTEPKNTSELVNSNKSNDNQHSSELVAEVELNITKEQSPKTTDSNIVTDVTEIEENLTAGVVDDTSPSVTDSSKTIQNSQLM